MAIKLLVEQTGNMNYRDSDEFTYATKRNELPFFCANCGIDLGTEEVYVNLNADNEFWCSRCVIVVSSIEIIQMYEECRRKLDDITDVVGSVIHSLHECINKEDES
jgi:hypothetical protein